MNLWIMTVLLLNVVTRTDPGHVAHDPPPPPRYVHANHHNDTAADLQSGPPVVMEGYLLAVPLIHNIHCLLFYHLKHTRTVPLSIPVNFSTRSHVMILLLLSGVEPNPGPRQPRYPCGVCKRAVRDVGQPALACDECDQWCHKSCLEMNTLEFNELGDTDTPWYCPSCSSLNRTTVIYDFPEASDDHSSVNASGIINSTRSSTTFESISSPVPSHTSSADISNTTFSSLGSPTQASSPKPNKQPRQKRNSKSLRFLCINFQSARRKGKHISTLIETARPDIILGTETWLSNEISSSEIFDESLGFEVHRNDRPDSPHGGVLLAVRKELNISNVESSKKVEMITGTIQTKSKRKIVIGSYYRPPSRTDDDYLNDTKSEFLQLRKNNKRAIFVLGGDFNLPDISWKDNSIQPSNNYPHRVSQHFLDIASDLDLEQMVDFPTRKENTLDLILTTHPSFTERCKPLPPIAEKSDHDIVLYDLAMQAVRSRPARRTIYLWKKADTEGIKAALSRYSTSFMDMTFSTVNDMWHDIKSTIDRVTEEFVPKRRTLAKHSHPWVNTHLRRLSKRKLKAYKKARRTKSPTDLARYTKLKAQAQREMRSSHKKYMTDVISSDYKQKPKQFWTYIKSKKQESFGVAPLKNKDGFIHSESSSKAEILNEQFKSVYTTEDMSSMPDKGPSPYPSMGNIEITQKGVQKQLAGLNSHKASGPDCIPTAMLKLAADELAPIFTRLYQLSLDTGEVPKDWRDALIVPVFKKGEKHLPANYRPVSLTSIVCKVLEHIVSSSVMQFFDQQAILTDSQHGFRSKRSCESQLLWTIETIASKLQGQGQVDVILLDFAKAFDKVPHQRLLYKLKYYGVRGDTARWIGSFLAHRKQRVLLEGETSSEADVVSGVPQGTVLGPLLFLAYINDLPDCVSSSETRLFADDSLLFRPIKSKQDADLLQQDLSALEKWEKDWQMKFHPEKCTVLRINRSRRHRIETSYTLHGQTLQNADSSKYLGVTLSDDLSWKKHISNTAAKGNRTLGFIRRNLGECTQQVKSAAYTTIVRPSLEYASTVWDPSTASEIHTLEQVQRKAARFVHNRYTDRTPGCVSKMVEDLDWESLQRRRYLARLNMLFKIQNGIVEVPTNPIRLNDQRTRGQNRLYQIRATTSIYKLSFFPRTISDWNLLPVGVTNCHTLEEFRANVASLPMPASH